MSTPSYRMGSGVAGTNDMSPAKASPSTVLASGRMG